MLPFAVTYTQDTSVYVSFGRFSVTLDGFTFTAGVFGPLGVIVAVKLTVPLNPVWVTRAMLE